MRRRADLSTVVPWLQSSPAASAVIEALVSLDIVRNAATGTDASYCSYVMTAYQQCC